MGVELGGCQKVVGAPRFCEAHAGECCPNPEGVLDRVEGNGEVQWANMRWTPERKTILIYLLN